MNRMGREGKACAAVACECTKSTRENNPKTPALADRRKFDEKISIEFRLLLRSFRFSKKGSISQKIFECPFCSMTEVGSAARGRPDIAVCRVTGPARLLFHSVTAHTGLRHARWRSAPAGAKLGDVIGPCAPRPH